MIYEKECVCCNKPFNTKHKNTKTCSRSCTSKYKWSDPSYKEKVKLSIQNAAKSKERNDKISAFHKEYQNRKEIKEKHSSDLIKRWSDINYKDKVSKKIKEKYSDDKFKENQKKINKDIANRSYVRTAKKEAMLKIWEDTEYKKQASAKQKVSQNRKTTTEKRRNSMIIKWSDIEYANDQLKNSYAYKEFILPSGKIVKLQGYEPIVLADLLKTYDENDIVISVKDIHNCIGKIHYLHNNVKRSYYPDFYIKSTNTIIEVKSKYTFEKHKEKNLLKEAACKSAGLNFLFIVL